MARVLTEGMRSPHPLIESLPGLYQDHDFIGRFVSAFDDVLAPVFTVLDGGFEAHLDPWLVPEDFLDWLGSWLGLLLEEGWDSDRQRDLIANAVELYRWRGTVRGLADAVALLTGEVPEILESGGVAWSPTPGAAIPGTSPAQIVVRVADPRDGSDLAGRVERIVMAAKPAHLYHRIELV